MLHTCDSNPFPLPWYAYDNPSQSQPNLPATELNGIVGQDPSFANIGSSNFVISGTSPAATAGLTNTISIGDMAGICFAGPPSIGAYQVP